MRRDFLFFLLLLTFFVFAQSDIQYQYDNLNRLERIEYPNGTVIVYTYDEVGNRRTQTITNNTTAPTANFSADPTSGFAPLQVTFNDASVPGANPITSWQWDFDNDGTVDVTGKGPHIYTYQNTGSYSVKLTVSDGVNPSTHTKQDYINVGEPGNQPPIVANPISNQTLYVGGLDFTRDLESPPVVFTDPNGDVLNYSASSSNETVATAIISSGSLKVNTGKEKNVNSGISGEKIEQNIPSLRIGEKKLIPFENTGSLLIVSPVGEGTATITITADDGNGGMVSTTFEVNVEPASTPPTADFVVNDTYGTAPFTLTFTDASISGSNPITSWEWDFQNDGIFDATGQGPHSYTYNLPGTYSVRLRVSDGSLSHTLIKQDIITVVDNQAPIVANTISNQSLSVGGADFVLDLEAAPAVFSDPDNDPLTYTASSSDNAIATAAINGTILTVSPVVEGTAIITVEADDGNGGIAATTFQTAVGGVGYSNDFLWAKRAGGTNYDAGSRIVTDGNGNIIVSGRFNLSANFGSITINSSEYSNIFVAKYDNSGTVIWAKHIAHTSTDFPRNGLAVDNSGNIYITGGFNGTADFGTLTLTSVGDVDIFVAKYDPVGNLLWAKRAGGIWPDYGHAAAVDPTGNCCVIGRFMQTADFGGINLTSAGSTDIFVTKYDPNGNVIWAKGFGGDGGDEAFDIVADVASNTYITGKFNSSTISFDAYSLANSGYDDAFIVKLNNDGNVVWANQGASSDWENGYGIALDGFQNIYVTGGFASATMNFGSIQLTSQEGKVFVVKYNPSGNPLWAIAGGGAGNAIGYGITVNSSNEVMITGYFDSNPAYFGNNQLTNSGSHDVFVAALDASGSFKWALQGGGSSWDRAYDITSDGSDLGLIVGSFENTATFSPFTLTSDGQSDIFFAKTDEAVVSNHFPVVLNSIPNQNLVVGDDDFVKDLEEQPAVFSDPDGDLLSYSASSSNEAIATTVISGSILSVSPVAEGSVMVTVTADDGNGGSVETSFTVEISATEPAPEFLWATSAGGINTDEGRRITTDSNGNIIIVGSFRQDATFGTQTITAAGTFDIFLAKYDPLGNFLWVWQTGGSGENKGYDVAVDASDDIVITGTFTGSMTIGTTPLNSNGFRDILVSKFDPNGNPIWAKSAGGSYNDNGFGISTDASSNVFVTGNFEDVATFGSTILTSQNNTDLFVAKLDLAGNWGWVAHGYGNGWETAHSIVCDPSNNVFITGAFVETLILGGTTLTSDASFSDMFVAKINTVGTVQWAKQVSSTSDIRGYDISSDSEGHVLVTGYFYGQANFGISSPTSTGSEDMFVAKYDPNGTIVWVQSEGGISNDIARGIALDSDNNVYVIGDYYGPSDFGSTTLPGSNSQDIFLVKYNQSGNFRWAKNAGGDGNGDYGYGITTDPNNNVFSTGSFMSTAVFDQIYLNSSDAEDMYVSKLGIDLPGNQPPLVINPIGNQSLYATGNNFTKDLEAVPIVFSDPDNDPLTYSASSSDNIIATADIAGTVLTVVPLAEGNVTITVTADDGNGGQTSTGFSVIVNPAAPTLTELKLTAGDGAADDNFGRFAVDIDGRYAVAGALFDDDNGDNSGAAYVYRRDGTSWIQEVKLLPDDGSADDLFGRGVCISGDYIIVGASGMGYTSGKTGAVYIFKRNGSSWIEESKLTANDAAPNDWFGTSVSIDGGYLIIGSALDDDGGENSGSAYIFKFDGINWIQEAKLTASDAAIQDEFGSSVSISGDYAIVSAHERGASRGAAYIFKRSGSSWTQTNLIIANDGADGDKFGTSVDISGDYAVCGAFGDDDLGSQSGSAYIFKRNGESWELETKLTAGDGGTDDNFGLFSAIWGDYAVVSSFQNDASASNSGAVYIFQRDQATWPEIVKLIPSDASQDDYFGSAVSIKENQIIGGAFGDDDYGSGSGSAYIYSGFIPGYNFAPDLVTPIDDQNLIVEGSDFTRDLEATPVVFADPDGDNLTYSASSGDEGVAIATIAGNILTVSPVSEGTATITVSADDGNGGLVSNQFLVDVTKTIGSIKVFLEGCFSENTMLTTLNINNFLPLTQPYTISPWNYSGTENVPSIPADVVDWVLVELRTNIEANSKIATRAAFIKNDGSIVDLDGVSPVTFSAQPGDYYLVIRHRNHLAVMSANTVELSESSSVYDFTVSQSQAYGTNPMKQLNTNVYGIISGDGNADGIVNTLDRVMIWRPQNGTTWDYTKSSDFNLDGGIDATDLNFFWRPNEGSVSQVPETVTTIIITGNRKNSQTTKNEFSENEPSNTKVKNVSIKIEEDERNSKKE